MCKLLKNETCYATGIIGWINSTGKKREEIDKLFQSDGGAIGVGNRYLKRLIKAIKKGYMSLEGFTVKDAESFGMLLDSDKLDSNLQSELSHLLYGADERVRHLS